MSTQRFPDILCLGEPMVELVRSGAADSDVYIAGVGGDTSNAAIAAARQGANVGYLTALGDDRFGERILKLWAHEGVDATEVQRDPDAPTGLYVIDPDPVERHFTYFRTGSAASLYRKDRLPSEYLAKASILHVSGITLAVSNDLRATAFDAMRQVRMAGGCVSLDTNLRLKLWNSEDAREVISRAAELATVLITSIDDSETLNGLKDPKLVLSSYASLGCRIIIVTRGEQGAILQVGTEIREIPSFPATAIDSTGAGDSFAGAFLAWWHETGDAWKAANLASVAASGTVSGLGAVDPIPDRKTVLRWAVEKAQSS